VALVQSFALSSTVVFSPVLFATQGVTSHNAWTDIIARLAQALNGAGEKEKAKELLVSAINLSLERGYKNRFLSGILCDLK